MNSYKPSNKLIIFCFTSALLLTNNSYAVDMGVLQEQCAEIGFKMKTPANGKCVLRLMKSVANQKTPQAVSKTPAINSTSSNGALVNWTMVGSTDGFIAYHDLGSIQESGYRVKIWTLKDSKTTVQIDGVRFLSAKIQVEYDCKEDQIRPLAGSALSGNMGQGDIVHSESNQPGQWKPIERGSFDGITGEIVCGKSFTKEPVQQQNEASIGTNVVELLGAAAQGWNQGMRQSVPVPSYQPRTSIPFPSYQPTKINCNSEYSSLSKSVDTTCTQH